MFVCLLCCWLWRLITALTFPPSSSTPLISHSSSSPAYFISSCWLWSHAGTVGIKPGKTDNPPPHVHYQRLYFFPSSSSLSSIPHPPTLPPIWQLSISPSLCHLFVYILSFLSWPDQFTFPESNKIWVYHELATMLFIAASQCGSKVLQLQHLPIEV